MSEIISRYILRETLQTWLAVTVVLLIILVTNQFAAVLGDAAANRLPRDAILELMALTSVQYLTILVPVGLFLAIMLALARLYHDSEMAAIMACGIGPTGLYRPLLLLGGITAVIVGGISLYVAPAAVGRVVALAEEARREVSLAALEAGRFIPLAQTDAVVYASEVTRDGRLRDVFVQRRVGERVEVILADEAWQTDAGEDGSRILVFARGHRYEGVPGSPRFRVIGFAEHGIPYRLPDAGTRPRDPEGQTTMALLRSEAPADRAELHWRIAVPLTALVLVVIAVPLARTEPRRGRFSGIAPAVLVYLIYANLLAVGRGWLEREQVPPLLGLWWVHLLFLAAAGLMLATHQGAWRRLRRVRRPVAASA
jgi:lipopolysaccharide export system permease protein